MLYCSNYTDGYVYISVHRRRLDAACCDEFRYLLQQVKLDGAKRVSINLEQVAFMDSTALAVLVGFRKLVGKSVDVELLNLTNTAEKMFKLCRMDLVFKIQKPTASSEESPARRRNG